MLIVRARWMSEMASGRWLGRPERAWMGVEPLGELEMTISSPRSSTAA